MCVYIYEIEAAPFSIRNRVAFFYRSFGGSSQAKLFRMKELWLGDEHRIKKMRHQSLFAAGNTHTHTIPWNCAISIKVTQIWHNSNEKPKSPLKHWQWHTIKPKSLTIVLNCLFYWLLNACVQFFRFLLSLVSFSRFISIAFCYNFPSFSFHSVVLYINSLSFSPSLFLFPHFLAKNSPTFSLSSSVSLWWLIRIGSLSVLKLTSTHTQLRQHCCRPTVFYATFKFKMSSEVVFDMSKSGFFPLFQRGLLLRSIIVVRSCTRPEKWAKWETKTSVDIRLQNGSIFFPTVVYLCYRFRTLCYGDVCKNGFFHSALLSSHMDGMEWKKRKIDSKGNRIWLFSILSNFTTCFHTHTYTQNHPEVCCQQFFQFTIDGNFSQTTTKMA